MSVIKIRDVAYPILQVPDLDLQEKFLIDFGMERVLLENDVLYMCGAGDQQFLHVTHKGEKKFRIVERESLMEVCKKDNIVIATGGGTPCFFDNMEEILVSGKAIYLKMKIKDLLERLETEKSQRPVIKNKSAKELENFIRNKLSKREYFYKKSDYILQGKNICEKEIQNLIL